MATKRLFKNVFVCKACGQKMRSEPVRVISKKIICRKCGKKSFRPIKSKKK